MKKLVILAVALSFTGALYGQAMPQGVVSTIGDGVFYLNKASGAWMADRAFYADTLNIGVGFWSAPFKPRGGFVCLEGVAILTAATDSFKVIAYGSNSQHSLPVDSTMLVKLDSTKVLTSGLYSWVINLAGKYRPWVVLQWKALNPGASITGKSRRTSIGLQ